MGWGREDAHETVRRIRRLVCGMLHTAAAHAYKWFTYVKDAYVHIGYVMMRSV